MPEGKKGKTSYSRGYCGHYETWEGRRVFLRSRLEFLYATWLDYNRISYSVESCVYKINEKSYKPDFFIYEEGGLVRVVEIKGWKGEKELYLSQFKSFFENILKVSYEVLCDVDLFKLTKTIPEISKKTEEWINYCVDTENAVDMRGENNPRYGCSWSSEFRENFLNKVQKTKSDSKWKEEESKRKKAYFQTLEGKEAIEKRRVKMIENGGKIRETNRKKRERPCPICGYTFDTTNKTCSKKCASAMKSKNSNVGIISKDQVFQRQQMKFKKLIDKIIFNYGVSLPEFFKDPDSFIRKAKKDNLIYSKMGISAKAIEKYEVKELLWEN